MKSDSARGQRFLEHLEPLQTLLEAYCRRHLLDGSAVEDTLQTVITLAFRDFHRFAEGTNFRAWIFRYLNLEIRNRNRKWSSERTEPLLEDDTRARPESPAVSEELFDRFLEEPEAVLDHCDDVFARTIQELPELERSVLLLRAIGEFSYREIAGVVEIPVGSVMGYLSRARQRLRERLIDHCRQEGFWNRIHDATPGRQATAPTDETSGVEPDSSGGEP